MHRGFRALVHQAQTGVANPSLPSYRDKSPGQVKPVSVEAG